MASRKIRTYQNKAKNLCTIYFVFDLNGDCYSLKQNIIAIKEMTVFFLACLIQSLMLALLMHLKHA